MPCRYRILVGMAVKWLTVFFDFPADTFDAGVAFWREVTGSGLSPFRGADGEFATLVPASAPGSSIPCPTGRCSPTRPDARTAWSTAIRCGYLAAAAGSSGSATCSRMTPEVRLVIRRRR
jgi:hypothetical protein